MAAIEVVIFYVDSMSKAYYYKIVGHFTIDEQDRKLLDVER